ncbi:hypothetical protein [Agrococcus sp. ProA11]|uniref:WD40/YVTN/BNR-like repeat-containing protein n=1 Tax=Agrococcus chionoecetis TaxID=3153752 RepID=UPI00326197C0
MRLTPSITVAAAALVIGLAGCSAGNPPATPAPASDAAPPSNTAQSDAPAQSSAGEASLEQLGHIHAIDSTADGEILLASHSGLYRLDDAGTLAGPIGGDDFDGMGFTVVGSTLFASGHPGSQTPAELGSPSLGIIRSDDGGQSWSPVALSSEADFHVLTASPDGRLHGIATRAPELLSSADEGARWVAGTELAAVDLAATDDRLFAATEQGVQSSDDGGASFTLLDGAPLLYTIEVLGDGSLVGVDTSGVVQLQTAEGWERLGSVDGAGAFGVVGDDRILAVDDRGVVEITGGDAVVLVPIG